MENAKRKRGRPRKNNDFQEEKSKNDQKKSDDENIILFLALDDDVHEQPKIQEKSQEPNQPNQPNQTKIKIQSKNQSTKIRNNQNNNDENDSGEDNRFTVHDTETKNAVDSLSDSESDSDYNSDSDSDSDSDSESFNISNNDQIITEKQKIKMLIDELKRKDTIINNLKNRTNISNSHNPSNKNSNISYHCVQLVDSKTGEKFIPQKTNIECWWCDHSFDNLPAFIANYYRNGEYYIFGNFCSFNCAAKYNIRMLKDYKCVTRHALINSLKIKTTKDMTPIKLASERETLEKKGGKCSIEKYREDFCMCNSNMTMDMPPMIPLMHVIDEGN